MHSTLFVVLSSFQNVSLFAMGAAMLVIRTRLYTWGPICFQMPFRLSFVANTMCDVKPSGPFFIKQGTAQKECAVKSKMAGQSCVIE